MTEVEFLALPEDDGVYRELIRGELRERPGDTRGYAHGVVPANIAYRLGLWSDARPESRDVVLVGKARIRLSRDPITIVGADLAFIPAGMRPANPREAPYVDGPPPLVVEMPSFSDTIEDIDEKILEYLEAGVSLVWVVDHFFGMVTVHRAGTNPMIFAGNQEIAAEPLLPGFRVPVALFFDGAKS